ncbi:DoxX-like family protein [Saltatorellus ferox]|uniref:DoxX-like family protein n=1 Tax=Saltatorellus ferox TaxID=2528018 RepID=UPI003AF38DB9
MILVFAYHGIVPKLWLRDAGEQAMLRAGGVPEGRVHQALIAMGMAELAWAFVLLAFGSRAWPYLMTIVGMFAALVMVGIQSPAYLGQAFNPVTLNLGVASLAGIAWMHANNLPSARRCLRRKPKES